MTDCDTAAPERLWFLDGVATIIAAKDADGTGLSVIEHRIPHGSSPPVHVHHDEEEVFHVLEGTARFRAGDAERVVGPGDTVHIPRGVPHGFRVLSPEGARWLTVTTGGFEAMLREVSRPAPGDGMPAPFEPGPELQAALAAACARNGITVLGAPLA